MQILIFSPLSPYFPKSHKKFRKFSNFSHDIFITRNPDISKDLISYEAHPFQVSNNSLLLQLAIWLTVTALCSRSRKAIASYGLAMRACGPVLWALLWVSEGQPIFSLLHCAAIAL